MKKPILNYSATLRFIILFVAGCLLFVPQTISAQTGTTCAASIPLISNHTDSLINNQEEWFSFTAIQTVADIKLIDLAPTQAGITSMTVFSGTCSSFTQIGNAIDTVPPTDSLEISISGLTIGNTYYIKVRRDDPVSCGSCTFGTFAPFDIQLSADAFITIDGAFGSCYQDISNNCIVNVCIGHQLCFSLDGTSQGTGGTAKWNITGSSCPTTQFLLATDTTCCVFNTLGTFFARVKHTDALGNISISPIATINVIPAPNSSLSISNPTPCLGDTVCFTLNSNVTNYTTNTFQWTMDGNPYYACNMFNCSNTLCFPDNLFSTPDLTLGTHTITVITNNEAGCIDTVTQTIKVGTGNISFTHDTRCNMKFNAIFSCQNSFVSWFWNFGDPLSGVNDTASGVQVIHTFTTQGGNYIVTLTGTDINGNAHTYTQTVHATVGPSAIITGIPTNNCGGASMVYNAPCATGINYQWIVLNGSSVTVTPNGCTATIDWNTAGDTLILIATDPTNDCFRRDTIYIPPCCTVPGFNFNPISHPNGNIIFDNTSASAVLQNPLYATLITGTTFTATTNNIIINGVFTIDTTFKFYRCNHINPGGNALIDVLPMRTLSIDSSTVDNRCALLWEGIRVTDSTAMVNIVRSTLVRNARNCVHSFNGGRYLVERSELRNNVRNIVVEFFNKPNPSIVRQTKFKFTGTFLSAVPSLPTWEQKTYVGIYITDNRKMTIGDSTRAVYQNTFDNLYNGIQINRSSVNVYNNNIKNITFNSLAPSIIPTGFGLDALGGRVISGNPTYILNIGSSTNSLTTQNNFNICNDGIRVFAPYIVRVMGNTFAKIPDICCDLTSTANNVTIYKNLVNGGTTTYLIGFRVRNSGNGLVTITNNIVVQGNTITSNNRLGVGILLETTNPSSAPATARIKYNNVNRNRVGIWLRNVQPLTSDSILVRGNNIDMQTNWSSIGLPTLPHTGISLQNSTGIFADTNSVVTSGNFAPAGSDTLIRGMLVENTSFSVLSDNTIKKMQSGIMARNNAFAVFYVCNTLQKNNNGFFFTGTSGSALVGVNEIYNPSTSTPAPTGNHFISNTTNLRGGISPPITWYFDPTNPVGANPITGATFTSLSSSLLICGQFYLPPFGGGGGGTTRATTVGTAITSATQVASDTGNVYYSNLYSLRQLRMNPSWLSLNLPDDTMYQNFYAAKNNSCMGGLCNVNDLIRTGNCTSACSINSGLNPVCSKDQNQKTVNEIYFRSWDQGQVWFTPQDSATLLSIALTNPQEGGEAVYGARVMLGLDQEEYGNSSSMRMAHIEDQETVEPFKVYPNPASDALTIDYKLSDGQMGAYEILNLNGQLIQSGILQVGTPSQQVSTSQLSIGVYMIRVSVDGEMIGNEKLVIIRQ